MTLRIHIDRIAIEGIEYSTREIAQLKSALSEELTQRMSLSGISRELMNGGSLDSVRVAGVSLPEKPSAAQSGRAIARAVHGGIAK